MNTTQARIAAALAVGWYRVREAARQRSDAGAITIEQVGWAVFWVAVIGVLVGLFRPWLISKANSIIGGF